MNSQPADLYSPRAVKALFDEMSGTYGVVNLIASLGFTLIWRRVVFSKISNRSPGLVVVDLMTGMGELFRDLRSQLPGTKKLIAVDFSAKMCEQARIFDRPVPDGSADIVVCSFGLKTFSLEQQQRFAKEVARMLKPGGEFAFIEISTPPSPILRCLYEFYIRLIIPMIGKFCLGNPDNYRHLGVYTKGFHNSRQFHSYLKEERLDAHYFDHFFGCASGVYGKK
jgi:ubiquinone/menaquinone biosynthesis C-methylase UbiE